jgi:hypothetical protein
MFLTFSFIAAVFWAQFGGVVVLKLTLRPSGAGQ